MKPKFVFRLQGMFDGQYKEVRNIYKNGDNYTLTIHNKYIGTFKKLDTVIAVRDLWIYNRRQKIKKEGKSWDKYPVVPVYSLNKYEDMLKIRKTRDIKSLYKKLLREKVLLK